MQIDWLTEHWGPGGEGETAVYVLDAQGLEDFDADPQNLEGGADGATAAAMWANPLSFTVTLAVLAPDRVTMGERTDAIKAVTHVHAIGDRRAVAALDYTIDGQETRTVFARVIKRSPPTDETVNGYAAKKIIVLFEIVDPNTYTAEQTDPLTPGVPLDLEGGWAPSERWTWTVDATDGPVTRPQLVSSVDATAVVRLNGTVPDGKTLVVSIDPSDGRWEIDGVDVYGQLDNGIPYRPPGFFPIPPGGSTVTYSRAAGGGASTFTWRGAKP